MRDFLPVSAADMAARGWEWYDILLVTGDAYVDHPSFGTAVISRVLEQAGYRVAILAQPDWHSADAFAAMGRPEVGVFINAGNLDSMVAHYTAAKKRRREDFYSPGRKAGLRPDRACIVYANRAREAFPGVPILLQEEDILEFLFFSGLGGFLFGFFDFFGCRSLFGADFFILAVFGLYGYFASNLCVVGRASLFFLWGVVFRFNSGYVCH